MEFNKINIYCKDYDNLCFKLQQELDASFEEIDCKLGLGFIKTLGEIYIFEVRDKGKYLMAKLKYDI